MLIRRSFFDRAFRDETGFFERNLMGYCAQIFCSEAGGAVYLDRPMSVYRSVSEGSWTQTILHDQGFYRKWLTSYLSSLREADARTNYRFHNDFSVPIRRCHLSVLNNTGLSLEFRREHYSSNRSEVGFAGAVMWLLVSRLPTVHRLIRELRLAALKVLRRG